jgi:hypothetical protein
MHKLQAGGRWRLGDAGSVKRRIACGAERNVTRISVSGAKASLLRSRLESTALRDRTLASTVDASSRPRLAA